MTEEKPHALVCMPYAKMAKMHPRQVTRTCFKCGCRVGVYPSGQQVMREYPKMKVVCSDCAIRDVGRIDQAIPAGTLDEIRQEIRDSYQVKK